MTRAFDQDRAAPPSAEMDSEALVARRKALLTMAKAAWVAPIIMIVPAIVYGQDAPPESGPGCWGGEGDGGPVPCS